MEQSAGAVVSSHDSDNVQRNFLDLLSIRINSTIIDNSSSKASQKSGKYWLGPIARYHIEHESKLLEYWILLFHYLKLEALTAFPNEYVKTEILPLCPKHPETYTPPPPS